MLFGIVKIDVGFQGDDIASTFYIGVLDVIVCIQ